MKKLFLLPLLFFSTNSFPEELHNFNEINSAILTGKVIRIAVDFSKCTSANKEMNHISVGVFSPNEIQVRDNHIATSFLHFTLNDPSFPQKPVYEFVRYSIANDDTVTLTSQVLDAVNYTSIADKLSFNCKINSGVKFYS